MKKIIESVNDLDNLCEAKIMLPDEAQEFSRRQFMNMGMGLTAFASAAQIFSPLKALAQQQGNFGVAKKLVWINMSGGWDILETVDPKQSANDRVNLFYDYNLAHRLAGSATDVRVGRHFPNIAAIGQDVLLLRGLAMGTTSHDAGATYMDTGILSNNGRVNAASIPSIVASESGATIPIIQLNGGMDPRVDRGLVRPVSLVRAQNLQLYRSMYPTNDAERNRKIRLLDFLRNSVARSKAQLGVNDRLTGIEVSETKIRGQINANLGDKLALDDADRAAFVRSATASGGANARQSRSLDSFALALKLLKNDLVSCINMGIGGFDTHANQDMALSRILPDFDINLRVFVDELRAAGKLDSTLIVLYSDFGRTPRINGGNGRDHWPVGGAMMIGGGIQGGRAISGTDQNVLASFFDPGTGAATTSGDKQLNATHLGGAVLSLCLGSAYLTYRSYMAPLNELGALTMLK
jgi:uncharacterized protein (DUF1501 family)